MSVHLQREIDKLKKAIVLLGAAVEKNLAAAMTAVINRDPALARQIHESDDAIDRREVDIEEECLKVLALHQPVAIDLRFIVAVLKINSDLERIGDEAVNIASRALRIQSAPMQEPGIDLAGLSGRVQAMVKKSLDALVNMNPAGAEEVRRSDDDIDDTVRRHFDKTKEEIGRHPERVDALIEYLRIGRHLERIADHATNIAEDVIYMTRGEIVRHHPES